MLTDNMQISLGIRQDDSLSPILFNVIMDFIIEKVKTAAPGYRLTTGEFKIMCYKDDAVLVAQTEDNMTIILCRFGEADRDFRFT